MKYTRKDAQTKIEQLDEQIVKLMAQIEDVRKNTIDSDKEDFEKLVNAYEESSSNVKYKFYAYIIDNHYLNYGLFL